MKIPETKEKIRSYLKQIEAELSRQEEVNPYTIEDRYYLYRDGFALGTFTYTMERARQFILDHGKVDEDYTVKHVIVKVMRGDK